MRRPSRIRGQVDQYTFGDLLRPGMTVYIQGSVGEPSALLALVAGDLAASRDVQYVSVTLAGVNRYVPSTFHPCAGFTTFFAHGDTGAALDAGRVRFLPLHYSSTGRYLEKLRIDVALIQVCPPDGNGNCSLGLSVDFVPAIIGHAGIVVAEVNRRMPAPPDSPRVPYASLDYVLECEHELPELIDTPSTGQIDAIARNVAELIADGSTLQVGVGRLPDAVLRMLSGRRDLGIHGGLITAGVRALIESGVVTGAKKTLDRGRHVAGVAVGTKSLYEWAGKCAELSFMPVAYTHDVRVIAQLDRFVSVNAAMQVDLLGQANSEMLRGRQISGTGGLLDFVHGARLARNGRSVLVLPSSAANGTLSRIVCRLDADAVVTVPRADVDVVVTEYGIAELADKSIHERASALVGIAAPAFRDSLRQQWEETLRRPGAAETRGN